MTFRDQIKMGDQLLNKQQFSAAFDRYYQAYEIALRSENEEHEIEADESMRLCVLQSLEEEGFSYFDNCEFRKAYEIFTEAIELMETATFTTPDLTDYVAELSQSLRSHRKVARRYTGSEQQAQEAVALLQKGKFKQAKRACKIIRQQFPDHPIDGVLDKVYQISGTYQQYLKKGIDWYNDGEFEKAGIVLQKAYKIKPTDKVLDLIKKCKATNFYSSLLEVDRTGKVPTIKHIHIPQLEVGDIQNMFGIRLEDILSTNQDLFKSVNIFEDLKTHIFREAQNEESTQSKDLGAIIQKQSFTAIFKAIAEKEVKGAFNAAFKAKMDEVFDLEATKNVAVEESLKFIVQQTMTSLGTEWGQIFSETINKIKEKLYEEGKIQKEENLQSSDKIDKEENNLQVSDDSIATTQENKNQDLETVETINSPKIEAATPTLELISED